MPAPRLEFWFEFASTYSYLSAMRLPEMAAAAGVSVVWRPFLLGPIFAAQGWDTSPFNIYETKGRYMWRDVERRAGRLSLRFRRPEPFPQNGLLAARTALAGLEHPGGEQFCRNVFLAQFAEGRDISNPAEIAACADQAGLPRSVHETAVSDGNKSALRAANEAAVRHGLFGAPSFRAGGELFWGDDRLEDALDWAVRHG